MINARAVPHAASICSTCEARTIVHRARRVEQFLSQNLMVAEVYTNVPGTYVPVGETVRGFREILEGKHDDLPEQALYLTGTIDDAVEKARSRQERAVLAT